MSEEKTDPPVKSDKMTHRHIVAKIRQQLGKEYRDLEKLLESAPVQAQFDMLRLLQDLEQKEIQERRKQMRRWGAIG